MKMPTPIAIKFTKLVVAVSGITLLGIIIAAISKDNTLLLLSVCMAIAGSMKIINYYRAVKEEAYECVEGTLVWEHAGLARKRHTIIIEQGDGTQVQRILEGRYQLQVGSEYRFYIKKEPVTEMQLDLPEMLQPAMVVLGHEQLSFSPRKQI